MNHYTIYRVKLDDKTVNCTFVKSPKSVNPKNYEVYMYGQVKYHCPFLYSSIPEFIDTNPNAIIGEFNPQLMDILNIVFNTNTYWFAYTSYGWKQINIGFRSRRFQACKISKECPVNFEYSVYQLSIILEYNDFPIKERRDHLMYLFNRVDSVEDIGVLNDERYTRVYQNFLSLPNTASILEALYAIGIDFHRHFREEVFNFIECSSFSHTDIIHIRHRIDNDYDDHWFIRLYDHWIDITDNQKFNFKRLLAVKS